MAFIFFLIILEYSGMEIYTNMKVENEILKLKTAIYLLKQENNINQNNNQEIVENLEKEEPNYYAIGYAEVKIKKKIIV